MAENHSVSGAFVPRLTKPEAGNKYYIRKADGGYSDAIKGKPTDPDCNVLANCVGYAYGRFNEIGGYGKCKYLSPTNAENFIQYKGNLEVGQTPKLGACMVWQKGASLSGSDGAGHVAIVEQIVSDTEIVTSESGWNSRAFWTQTRKKGSGNWGQSSSYQFLGFIYNPAVSEDAQRVEHTTVSGTASTGSEADEKTIWDFLMQHIGNPFGVAGLMGNLYAESGLRSDNLQSTYEKKLGYTDKTYTAAVDSGAYGNFVKDSAGYGLAQWTYHTRKQRMLDYHRAANKSIGDLNTQLLFLVKELNENYPAVWKDLRDADSVMDASNSVLMKYERPSDQGQAVQKKRADYGRTYYDKYADKHQENQPETPEAPVYKVGDIVEFVGSYHYASTNAAAGPKVKAGRVKITAISKGGKHPYHCRAVNEAGKFVGGVYGWVDACDLKEIGAETPTTEVKKLEVTGLWDKTTTKRLQEIFKTPVDGVVSNQNAVYQAENPGLTEGWQWLASKKASGSTLIRTMQKWAGMPENEHDGKIGPKTIRAFQKKLGTPVDGKVSKPSTMVKALQNWANGQ